MQLEENTKQVPDSDS
jgi:WD40 repeat protein